MTNIIIIKIYVYKEEGTIIINKNFEKYGQELELKLAKFNPVANRALSIKLDVLVMITKIFEVDTSTIIISDNSFDNWVADIKQNLKVEEYKVADKKIDILEKQLITLLCDNKHIKLHEIRELQEIYLIAMLYNKPLF